MTVMLLAWNTGKQCFSHPYSCCADLWVYLDLLLAVAVWRGHYSFLIHITDKIDTGNLRFRLATQANEKGSWVEVVLSHNMVLYYDKTCHLRAELLGFQIYLLLMWRAKVWSLALTTGIDIPPSAKGIVPERTGIYCSKFIGCYNS